MARIAVNIRRNHLRRRWRQAKTSQNGRAQPIVAIESLADRGDTVHEQQHRAEQIAEVLDAMPERQEAVLRAKYLDGLSVNEIATKWNETPKAVESLLSRARGVPRTVRADGEFEIEVRRDAENAEDFYARRKDAK